MRYDFNQVLKLEGYCTDLMDINQSRVNGTLTCNLGDILPVHCVKSFRNRSYSGPYFPAFGLNTEQNNCEYGQFSHGSCISYPLQASN